MACILCNITSCRGFAQGGKPVIKNPFFCKTARERKEFLDTLANDIASQHPELLKRILFYKLKKREEQNDNRGNQKKS